MTCNALVSEGERYSGPGKSEKVKKRVWSQLERKLDEVAEN